MISCDLLESPGGWRSVKVAIVIAAAFGPVLPPVFDTRQPLPGRKTEPRVARGLAEVLRTPPIFVAAGIEAVMYLGYGAFLGFLPIHAKKVGLNGAEIAIVLGAQLALAMLAKPITGEQAAAVLRSNGICFPSQFPKMARDLMAALSPHRAI
jgi:hypothetical protein